MYANNVCVLHDYIDLQVSSVIFHLQAICAEALMQATINVALILAWFE